MPTRIIGVDSGRRGAPSPEVPSGSFRVVDSDNNPVGSTGNALDVHIKSGGMDDRLVDGSQKTQIIDASGNVIGSTAHAIDVNIKSGVAVAVTLATANNSWGQSLAVTSGATSTIINIPSSPAGYQLKGFVVHGNGDGYFFVQVAGATVLSARTRSTLPAVVVTLPNGVAVATGSVVALKVTNESGSTADFEATLLGL
jgi:hypothetical protein